MDDNPQQDAMQINMGGELINVEQDFFDKYPESLFAKWKAERRELGKENDHVEIDRSAKYFKKILEFSRDKQAIRFYQMSHMEIRKLRNDAAFFGIEDLVERCDKELKILHQSSICSVKDQRSLDLLLADETRLVIIVDSRCCHNAEVVKACELLNRDKCLIISRQGNIEGHSHLVRSYDDTDHVIPYGYILYDPKKRKMLWTRLHEDESDILAMIYYAETLTPYVLDYPYHDPTSENVVENENAMYVCLILDFL